MKTFGLATAVIGALIAAVAPAHAAPVDVSYAVSGSAGNWLLDFSVTDNLGNANYLYFFGVELPTNDVATDPSGWSSTLTPSYNNASAGGSSIDYNNVWISIPVTGSIIVPGQTQSGFQAIDTDLAAPSSVNWFAYASGVPDGNCEFNCGSFNAGFEGTAVASVAATPLPGSVALFATALTGLGFTGWRRKRAGAA